jgi:hypothetical protein
LNCREVSAELRQLGLPFVDVAAQHLGHVVGRRAARVDAFVCDRPADEVTTSA